jgi:hypothetical protein
MSEYLYYPKNSINTKLWTDEIKDFKSNNQTTSSLRVCTNKIIYNWLPIGHIPDWRLIDYWQMTDWYRFNHSCPIGNQSGICSIDTRLISEDRPILIGNIVIKRSPIANNHISIMHMPDWNLIDYSKLDGLVWCNSNTQYKCNPTCFTNIYF